VFAATTVVAAADVDGAAWVAVAACEVTAEAVDGAEAAEAELTAVEGADVTAAAPPQLANARAMSVAMLPLAIACRHVRRVNREAIVPSTVLQPNNGHVARSKTLPVY